MPRTISDIERRRRIVARHLLDRSGGDALSATSAVAAMHSTDPTTPFLGTRARVPRFQIGDLESILYEDLALQRMHAMRRTLFLVPTPDVPVFEAGAAREVARKERARLLGWMTAEMPEGKVARLLERLAGEVVVVLGEGGMSTRELSAAVPGLDTRITVGQGKWSTTVPLSSRLLFLMAMDGLVVRGRPAGTWRSSQYRWELSSNRPIGEALTEGEGRIGVAHRYLVTHGPVTTGDLKWWTGWTLTQTRQALAGIDVEEVALDGGGSGFVVVGDTSPTPAEGPTVSLLPSLDPTVMGWRERHWYLGPHGGELFDTSGNAGPTVWVDGRVVGGWGQRADGEVVFELLEKVGTDAGLIVEDEAATLTSWLDGVVVIPRFDSPMGRRLSGR